MEMHAALGLEPDRVEEQIHQHRLAAPDRPMDVEPARRRRLRLAEAEERAFAGLALFKRGGERVERLRHRFLVHVARQPAGSHGRAITLKRPLSHTKHL
jgi:hypothetical protein